MYNLSAHIFKIKNKVVTQVDKKALVNNWTYPSFDNPDVQSLWTYFKNYFVTQVDKKAEAIIDAARRKEAIGVEKAGLVKIVISIVILINYCHIVIVIKESIFGMEKAGLVGIVISIVTIVITVNIVITKGKISWCYHCHSL